MSPEPSPETGTNEPEAKGGSLLTKGDGPTGAPEKYEAFTVPEGFEIIPEKLTEVVTLFKELNLPQEGAQKLVDYYAKELLAATEAPVEHWLKLREQWQSEVSSDSEIGGKLKEVRATVGKAIDTHLGPVLGKEFKAAMDLTGAGDHPAFVKGIYKLAQLVTEGRHVTGTGPSQHGQRPPNSPTSTGAAAMYPNLPSAGS